MGTFLLRFKSLLPTIPKVPVQERTGAEAGEEARMAREHVQHKATERSACLGSGWAGQNAKPQMTD